MADGSIGSVRLYTFNQFLDLDFVDRIDIVTDLLPVQGRMIIGGVKGTGKTMLAQQMMTDIASGNPILGYFDVPRKLKVAFFQKEVPDKKFQERLEKASKYYMHIDPDNMIIPPAEDIVDLRLDNARSFSVIEEIIASERPDVSVFDPMYLWHSLDENSASDIKRFLMPIDKLRMRYNMAVIINHHNRKPQRDYRGRVIPQNMFDLRGISVIEDWADTVLTLNDQGADKLLLTIFSRTAAELPPEMVLTRNRKYARFDADVQGSIASAGEFAAAAILSRHGGEMMYSDLVYEMQKHKVGKRQSGFVLSTMASKHLVYYTGNGNGSGNGSRVVRTLTPAARRWLR